MTIVVALITMLGTGGGVSTYYSWKAKKVEMETTQDAARIDAAQAHIEILRAEVQTLRAEMRQVEANARAERSEAWHIQDRARLALSLAVSHITRLELHIAASIPPPAPARPADLEKYVRELLWSEPVRVPPPTGRPPPPN